MTEHHGHHARGEAYEVIVQGKGIVWHGTDHTHAETAYKRYVGQYAGLMVELHHNDKLIKWHLNGETKVEHAAYSEGTVC